MILIVSIGAPLRADDRTHDIDAARQLTTEAREQLHRRDYAAAVASLQQAIRAWKGLSADRTVAKEVEKERHRCEKDLAFAVQKPLNDRLQQARDAARRGQIENASRMFFELISEYDRALKQYGFPGLAQNRRYCINYTGLVAIRHADKLRQAGDFLEAGRYYRLALMQYRRVSAFDPAAKIANNVKYAETYLPQVEFAARLADHGPAPAFDLRGIDGRPVRLDDYRGKPVLLVIWASWCGTCRKHLPVLNKFQDETGGDRVAVVGLCVDRLDGWDRGKAAVAERLVVNTLSFPNAWCDAETLRAYGAPRSVPTAYWIDGQGRLLQSAQLENLTLDKLHREFRKIVRQTGDFAKTAAPERTGVPSEKN